MSQDWIAAAGRIALDSSLRTLAGACGVAAALVILRVRSSVVRHVAWSAVLGAMLLMPVLPHLVPAIPIALPIPASGIHRIPPIPAGAGWTGSSESSISAAIATQTISVSPVVVDPPAQIPWPVLAIGIYGLVTGILLLRLLLGWLTMKKIVTRSHRIDARDVGAIGVLESDVVTSPFAAGIFSSAVLLPADWRLWPAEKLRAVLAHELSHARRRDPLVGFLARLNRSIFWFHPLAWWLELELAKTAEQACDAAGVRAVASPQRYSEILLEMATNVRHNKGRLVHGVGIHGNGNLADRIDHILRSDFKPAVSPIRKAAVALACGAAILLSIACRQQPLPLQPDPKLKLWAPDPARDIARNMTPEQIAAVEAAFRKNPEDLDALKTILIYDAPDFSGSVVPHADTIVASRRKYILWLIAHHPDSALAGSFDALIFPTTQDPLPDPVGYEQAKKLWLAQTGKAGVSTATLSNAATFFETNDKQLSEQMLLRAATQQPDRKWSERLGRLYAMTLLGSNASMPMNVVRSVSAKDAEGPYAREVRHKLETTTDAVLLVSAAQSLMMDGNTGLGYAERALQLAPKDRTVVRGVANVQIVERQKRVKAALSGIPEESQYAAVSRLPERDRFDILPELAEFAYIYNESHDSKAARERSEKYAHDLLALAPKFRSDSEYGAAVFRANIALGTVAMRNGDKKSAVRYLRAASTAPLSESSFTGFLGDRLITSLLKYGERESVATFLDWRATESPSEERDRLLHSASQIRNGVMPEFYQRSNS